MKVFFILKKMFIHVLTFKLHPNHNLKNNDPFKQGHHNP